MPRRDPSALTATLPLCEIIATPPAGSAATESPQSPRSRREVDDPVAVRPADRERGGAGGRDQPGLELAPRFDLAEARRDDDGAAAAERDGVGDRVGDGRRRDGDGDRVDGAGQVAQRRDALDVADPLALRVDAPELAVVAEPLEVAQEGVAVGALAVGGADDRDRSRCEQAGETAPRSLLTAQCSIRSTPRRSRPRTVTSRWISLVPSQIRSTRSSRRKRSATFERR